MRTSLRNQDSLASFYSRRVNNKAFATTRCVSAATEGVKREGRSITGAKGRPGIDYLAGLSKQHGSSRCCMLLRVCRLQQCSSMILCPCMLFDCFSRRQRHSADSVCTRVRHLTKQMTECVCYMSVPYGVACSCFYVCRPRMPLHLSFDCCHLGLHCCPLPLLCLCSTQYTLN